MKRSVKLAGALLAAPVAGMMVALAPMAQASPNNEPCQGASGCHHGVSGCFAWSWVPGDATTTVYYHNRCSTKKTLNIWWSNGGPAPSSYHVPGNGKGNGGDLGGFPVKIDGEA